MHFLRIWFLEGGPRLHHTVPVVAPGRMPGLHHGQLGLRGMHLIVALRAALQATRTGDKLAQDNAKLREEKLNLQASGVPADLARASCGATASSALCKSS